MFLFIIELKKILPNILDVIKRDSPTTKKKKKKDGKYCIPQLNSQVSLHQLSTEKHRTGFLTDSLELKAMVLMDVIYVSICIYVACM